jgi:peptidoglycan/LPS O-acetylase OafA/YrhL
LGAHIRDIKAQIARDSRVLRRFATLRARIWVFMMCAHEYLEMPFDRFMADGVVGRVVILSENIDKLVSTSAKHGPSELYRIHYLDGWRGVAILLVLYAHFIGWGSMDTGRLGVDIFFVLSGFLMSKILFVKRVPLPTFYKRRISRIFPVFLLFVFVVYAVDFILLNTEEWKNFFYTLFFIRSYFPAEPDIWSAAIPIGHLWSLNVEEHCYILLSTFTLFKFLKGREGIALVLSGVLSIVIHLIYIKAPSVAPPAYGLRTEVVASHLLLSAGYCLISHHFTKYVKPWMPVLACIIAALCYTDFFPWWSAIIISPFALAFAVNHLSETYGFIHAFLSLSLLRLMGIWSFSIYLWQQPFYMYKDEFSFALLALVPAIIIGLISFYGFENPSRTWLNRRWK